MGTHSDQQRCPRCGGANLMTCVDTGGYDKVSGDCLDCGMTYQTKEWNMDLDEVNELREMHGLDPIKKLRRQNV